MAVRRLHADQPEDFAFTAENDNWASEQVKKFPDGRQASAVIPLLWKAQEQEGWVSEPAIRHVAERLEMPYIRVLEVATFYTMFQLAPVGRKAHVQMCGTTPCMLRGSDDIREVCRKRIHPEPFHLSEDGDFSWEEVECLGACVNAPMALIGKDYYEDLTPESFEAILEAFARGEAPKPGPQVERTNAAPITGATTLTDRAAIERQPSAGAEEAPREPEHVEPPQPEPVPGEPEHDAGGTDLRDLAAEEEPLRAESEGEADPETRDMAQQAAGRPSSTGRPESEASRSTPVDEPDPKIGVDGQSAKPDPDVREARGDETVEETLEDEAAMAEALSKLPPDASPEDKANAVGKRPAGAEKPAKGEGDDLKRIHGVGPAIAKKLSELGIHRFDQIASWGREEERWVGAVLSFPGRVARDEWVRQAGELARGEEPSKPDRDALEKPRGNTAV